MSDSSKKKPKPNYYYFPINDDGTIILDNNTVNQSGEENARRIAFDDQHHKLENLINALGSHGIGCSHTHHNSPAHTQAEEATDLENQERPLFPEEEIEEAEDYAIKAGKAGEIVTSLGGALAIGPVLALVFMWCTRLTGSTLDESPWFTPNAELKVSPTILIISLCLVIPAAWGAPACHAQLEIASRTRNNFLAQAVHAQKLLKWGQNNHLEVNDPQLASGIDHFKLVEESEAPPLSSKQKLQIIGDVEQHFNEYVGLTIIAILRNIENPAAQAVLIATSLMIAAIACWPEVTTCKNTLVLMNAFKNSLIIEAADATNTANWQTKFSAFAKIPAVFYANFLSFQQICYGNVYAGLVLASLATAGNIVTQYYININTQNVGEASSHSAEMAMIDNRTAWNQLSLFGKALVAFRAIGTGNERSEPITITIIAIANLAGASLSSTIQAAIALGWFMAGTASAYSEARNAADHLARVGFFNSAPLQKNTNDTSATQPLLQN